MILHSLHQKSSTDYLQRITGNRSTHKVLYNARFREYRIVTIHSTHLLSSARDWVLVFSGTLIQCQSFKANRHG